MQLFPMIPSSQSQWEEEEMALSGAIAYSSAFSQKEFRLVPGHVKLHYEVDRETNRDVLSSSSLLSVHSTGTSNYNATESTERMLTASSAATTIQPFPPQVSACYTRVSLLSLYATVTH